MNTHLSSGLPRTGPLHASSPLSGMRNHTLYSLLSLSLIELLNAILFVPIPQSSDLTHGFLYDIDHHWLWLIGGITTLCTSAWRPFYFPVVAWLPRKYLFLA